MMHSIAYRNIVTQVCTVIMLTCLVSTQSAADKGNPKSTEDSQQILRDSPDKVSLDSRLARISDLARPEASRQNVELTLLEIKEYLSAEQYKEALRATHRLLEALEHSNDENISSIDNVLAVCALLRARGFAEESSKCEDRVLQLTTQNSVYVNIPYHYLQRALFRGQYKFLIAYARNHEEPDLGLHLLVARAAGTEFVRYWSVDLKRFVQLTPGQSKILNDLAEQCTEHYEAAVRLSLDQYTRTQLANEWLAFKAYEMFPSDSSFLLSQFPTHELFEYKTESKRIENQAEHFRAAAIKAMESGKQGQVFTTDTRSRIVISLAEEFKIYARIGIPDDVFNNLVDDMTFFFDEGLPMRFINPMSEPRELSRPFRWYLWTAIMKPSPDEHERREIERQLNTINQTIADNIRQFNVPLEYKSHFDPYIERWYSAYDRFKDCRFVPYFAHALPEYQLNWIREKITKTLNEINANYKKKRKANAGIPYANSDNKLVESYKRMGHTTLISIFVACTFFDRPTKRHLPDEIFFSDSGTMNEYSVYTFVPNQGNPL